MGLNATLAMASQSLGLFSTGIQVAGQNVSNAGTPGYIREELNIATNSPYKRGHLILGTGARGVGVQQQIDTYLESRIHTANADAESARVQSATYRQLELTIGELGDGDISSSLNNLLGSINELVNQPEVQANRQLAVAQGERLVSDIRSLRSRVDEQRESLNLQVESVVSEANSLVDQIAALNEQIVYMENSKAADSDAGALRVDRYNAMNRLSEIVDIQFTEKANGAVEGVTSSGTLVAGATVKHLETITSADRGVRTVGVRVEGSREEVSPDNGELRGLIESRDTVLGGFIDQLDTFTSTLVFEFNRIHSSGEGLKGFTSVTGTTRTPDTSVALNAANLPLTPEHGSFDLKITNSLTGSTDTKNIRIDLDGLNGDDTTLESLRDQINAASGGNVNASITTLRQLKLDTASGYEIKFSNDSSGVLAALGLNTFFTGSDSANISMNAVVVDDPGYLAVSQGGGSSDNRNAIELAAFIDQPVDALGGVSLDSFYDSTIAEVAQASASESAMADGYESYRQSLFSQREQISGVSLDEEAIKLLEFQRAYQAAARVISTVDELFSVLVSM